MIKFFLIPKEVWYYVVFPIILILIFYFIFTLFYSRKKGTYYYNYIVNYVYGILEIILGGLILCLLFGYSISMLQMLITNNLVKSYIILVIILVIIPLVPLVFLIYVLSAFVKNIKRKEILDKNLEAEINGEPLPFANYEKDGSSDTKDTYLNDKTKNSDKSLDENIEVIGSDNIELNKEIKINEIPNNINEKNIVNENSEKLEQNNDNSSNNNVEIDYIENNVVPKKKNNKNQHHKKDRNNKYYYYKNKKNNNNYKKNYNYKNGKVQKNNSNADK